MDVREATGDDVAAIRDVARESLTASYGHVLAEDVIAASVEGWYDAEGLADDAGRDDAVLLVGVAGDEVVGFVQSYVVRGREPVGEVDWLHVHPDHRGEGLGSELLAAVERALRDRGVDRIEARVLVANEVGGRFYADHGFDPVGEVAVEVGEESLAERRFVKRLDGEADAGGVEARRGPDGVRRHVDFGERERGSRAPFFAVYADADRTDRYGWFCANCEGFDTAMDSMGRMECNDCGNRRRPTRWDAAYL